MQVSGRELTIRKQTLKVNSPWFKSKGKDGVLQVTPEHLYIVLDPSAGGYIFSLTPHLFVSERL